MYIPLKRQDSYSNSDISNQQQDNDSERHNKLKGFDEECRQYMLLVVNGEYRHIKLVDNIESQYLTSGDVDQQGEFTDNQQQNQQGQQILPFDSKILSTSSKKAQSDDSNKDKMGMIIVLDYQESVNSKNNEINQSQQSIENSNNDEREMPNSSTKIKIPGETKNIYKAFHGALQNFMIDMQKDLKFELCPESQKFLDIKPKTSGKGKLLKSIKSCQQMRSIAKEFFCDYQWSGYLIKNNKVELERFFRLNQIIVSSIDN